MSWTQAELRKIGMAMERLDKIVELHAPISITLFGRVEKICRKCSNDRHPCTTVRWIEEVRQGLREATK